MKSKFLIIVFFISMLVSHAQGEANIWYFGYNAGLDFNSGSPVALTNGALYTMEGCASLSDASGNLLFYTDGVKVYNRNHQVMPNGSGLLGHPSSSQSATIVPKPGSSTLFYVFTIDYESNPNGFRYSIIDLNLESGLGNVTSEKNIPVYEPTLENLAVTKHSNGIDYWIVTHGWESSSYNAYLLSTTGLSSSPVTTNIGAYVGGVGFLEAGYMKIAPSGSKLAFTSVSDIVQLFDFNTTTGVLSNEQTLLTEFGELYGVEFSPNENVLYVSNTFNKLYQFDLTATDIPNSKFTLYNDSKFLGALQLGPDAKIYLAVVGENKLGVINNPDAIGNGCNFVIDGIDLGGKFSRQGLPAFNQSFFFTPSIQFQDACVNQNTSFNFNTNQTVTGASWNFGDGFTSSDINPNHSYTTAGTYNVSVVVNTTNGSGTNSRQITIHPQPTLFSNSVTLKQCDDTLDGFSNFNLNEVIPLLVTNSSGLIFSFYESQNDADNEDNPITNLVSYTNQTVSNDAIYVRVENSAGCYKTAQVTLVVSTTLIPQSFQITETECDDTASGANTDGIATFDFSDATSQIESLYPSGQLLTITYYKNLNYALAESNAILNTANYTNVGYPNVQNIYVRVDSQINNECLGLGHHITLVVDRIPIIQPQIIKHCDDNQDGVYTFDTTNLQANLLNGLTNVIVTYTDQNGNILQSPLPNSFTTSSQTINVNIKNNYGKFCEYNATIQFVVDDLPEIFGINTLTTTACDDEPFPNQQNGSYPFDTSNFQSTLVGNQTGMIVNYYDENNNPLPSPLLNPFTTATQNVTVEIINPLNTSCKATAILPFVVNPVPEIELFGNELICSNNPTFTKIIDAGVLDVTTIGNFTYQWFLNGVIISTETNYNLIVNTEGIYTVTVTNNLNCTRTRTLTVTASNTATVNTIEVTDLSNENSIVVLVSGQGDYQYSLDDQTYQNSNEFHNILPGIYTVFIRDKNGCGTVNEEVSVLGIPKYFTPNGDGFNDYWNIKGVTNLLNANAIIYIHDRFGKLLKQISATGDGWDGTYNGKMIPAEDYWYSITLENGRTIKGHFALKR